MKPEMWWTDPWNPIDGCSGPVSPGCDHCWARAMHQRFHKGESFMPHLTGAKMPEKPGRLFVCNTGDLFDHEVPQEWIDRVFSEMACHQEHRFLILTKRAERMYHYMMHRFHGDMLCHLLHPNRRLSWNDLMGHIWLGVSAENQEWYAQRMWDLQKLEAEAGMKIFVSVEPLIDPVHISWLNFSPDWVLIGAETGPGKRFCAVEWIRTVVGDCRVRAIPCFVKAIHLPTKSGKFRVSTDMEEWPFDIRVREYPKELII